VKDYMTAEQFFALYHGGSPYLKVSGRLAEEEVANTDGIGAGKVVNDPWQSRSYGMMWPAVKE